MILTYFHCPDDKMAQNKSLKKPFTNNIHVGSIQQERVEGGESF